MKDWIYEYAGLKPISNQIQIKMQIAKNPKKLRCDAEHVTLTVPFDFIHIIATLPYMKCEMWINRNKKRESNGTYKATHSCESQKRDEDRRWKIGKKRRSKRFSNITKKLKHHKIEKRKKKQICAVRECFPSHNNRKMTTKWLWCSFCHSAISFLLFILFVVSKVPFKTLQALLGTSSFRSIIRTTWGSSWRFLCAFSFHNETFLM